MTILSIETEAKLANNLIRSLGKGYKLSTDGDQVKFLYLSIYLLALGYAKESEAISEFISNSCEYTGNENTWHGVGHQILLLAQTKRLRGDLKGSAALVNRIVEEDVLAECVDKSDFLDEEVSEYNSRLEEYLSETPKWRCQGLAEMYMGLLYCREFVELVEFAPQKEVIGKTEPKMQEILQLLKENLSK